jgi:type IV pilus secretin PilQ/predicted competence protein
MKISAQSLAKLHRTLSAIVLTASASLAQNTNPPPAAPPVPFAPPTVAPIEPPSVPGVPARPGATAPAMAPGSPLVPAPIEPPIQTPGTLPGTTPGTVPAVPGDPTAAPGTTGTVPPAGTLDISGSHVSEFQGDDVSLVLRTLARQAKMNVVVSPAVTGQITLRVENKTPAEVIRIICQANGLIMDELESVVYIKTIAEKQKEPTESLQYTFSYAKAADIVPLLKSQLTSPDAPQTDTRTNTIFFREGKTNAEKVMAFLKHIDSPTRQVMIEARLVEVTANPKQSYGINWGGVVGSSATPMQVKYGAAGPSAVAGQPATVTNTNGKFQLNDFLKQGSNASSLVNGIAGQFSILSIQQMSLTMRLLNEDADAEFLANPRIVAANNEKATIKITRNQPVPQLNFNEQTAQAVFGGFQDKEFGNTLTVTPQINKDQFVSLKVQPEISNKVGDATFTFGGATVASPIIDKRTFDSNVLIQSGDTLAIGGLLQDELSKQSTKVPIAGDIPLFGRLFQEKMNTRTKRNLLVFVTPNIIRQGYGTGLEPQVNGLKNVGNEFADPNGWRNNARGVYNFKKTPDRPLAAEYPAPKSRTVTGKYKVSAAARTE